MWSTKFITTATTGSIKEWIRTSNLLTVEVLRLNTHDSAWQSVGRRPPKAIWHVLNAMCTTL
eukprot:1804685-Amphidinium_carterae.1